MKEKLTGAIAAFVALCTIANFSPASVLVFGAGCAIICAGIVLRRSYLGVIGLFATTLLSPFALEYKTISEGTSLIGATILVAMAVGLLMHVGLVSDERRRFDWKVDRKGVVAAVLLGLIVANSVVILSAIGTLGTFLGDPEATGVQVLVLASASALVFAALLVPTVDEAEARQA